MTDDTLEKITVIGQLMELLATVQDKTITPKLVAEINQTQGKLLKEINRELSK